MHDLLIAFLECPCRLAKIHGVWCIFSISNKGNYLSVKAKELVVRFWLRENILCSFFWVGWTISGQRHASQAQGRQKQRAWHGWYMGGKTCYVSLTRLAKMRTCTDEKMFLLWAIRRIFSHPSLFISSRNLFILPLCSRRLRQDLLWKPR